MTDSTRLTLVPTAETDTEFFRPADETWDATRRRLQSDATFTKRRYTVVVEYPVADHLSTDPDTLDELEDLRQHVFSNGGVVVASSLLP
jgi:hypothetical protein